MRQVWEAGIPNIIGAVFVAGEPFIRLVLLLKLGLQKKKCRALGGRSSKRNYLGRERISKDLESWMC